jgi:hypothetical protein
MMRGGGGRGSSANPGEPSNRAGERGLGGYKMPQFTIIMGDPLTGSEGRRFTLDADTLSAAMVGVYADPDAIGLVAVRTESDAPAPDAKRCGCRPDGLTRNVTLWECRGCGEIHGARRRRCSCNRVKPAHPRGYGCCARDWPLSATECGECLTAFDPDDAARLPHPEHHYLTESNCRGSFTDRRGIARCVGCHRQEG